MGVTSIFGFPYPEDSTPNDLHQFFMDLANAVETEMVRQGTLAARPAAGTRGRLYYATDDSLFRDDGTTWVRISAGPDKTYSPTWTRIADANPSFTIDVTAGQGFAEYILDGPMCWVNVHQLLTFNGGAQSASGVRMSLPVTPKSPAGISAEGQNAPLHQSLDASGAQLYPGEPRNSLWVMNSPFWFRVTGWYRVLGTARTA
jgi:hypothetical protein